MVEAERAIALVVAETGDLVEGAVGEVGRELQLVALAGDAGADRAARVLVAMMVELRSTLLET